MKISWFPIYIYIYIGKPLFDIIEFAWKNGLDLPALPFLIFEYEVYSLGSIIYQQAT